MDGIIYKNILFLLLFIITGSAQTKLNQYGLYVIDNLDSYYSSVEQDSNKLLVDLEKYIPGIVLDIRYATKNNFVGEPVYNIPKAFTRLPVAKALKKVQNELKKENLGLKIFDAYRPYSVTVQFFKKVKDTNYVASPKKGSRHNRGCAVDLTIIDLKTGKEIEMPTAYDDFTEKAASNFNDFPKKIIENREKLKKIMSDNGFKVFYSEWWHYDFKGWENYELVDISFEELSGLEKNKE
ncbi:MAG TPA: M15 family metallopeptidase [Ignavibacteriaceae bacterium]|nr:M15 family metallopeptidase [Ignavibacteriaceae bacterium]